MTAIKPSECSCKVCQNMCTHSPCMPNPRDVQKIISAGFADRLKGAIWADIATGMLWPVIMPEQLDTGCTFFKDGKCELHDKDLKPMEGRLANHAIPLGASLTRRVAYTWATELGASVMSAWPDAGNEAKHLRAVMNEIQPKTLSYDTIQER